jgi:hypothetical protein
VSDEQRAGDVASGMTRIGRMAVLIFLAGVTAVTTGSTLTHARSPEHTSALPSVASRSGGETRTVISLHPTATKVSAPCEFGPGRMSVSVLPLAEDGALRVRVRARGVSEGRWLIYDFNMDRPLRRTAIHGRWSAVFTSRTSEAEERPDIAIEASAEDGLCYVSARLGNPALGFTGCGAGKAGIRLAVNLREDRSLVLRPKVRFGAPAKTRWRLDLRARGGGQTQAVTFEAHSNRHAEVRGRVSLSDPPPDARFRVHATSRAEGTRCTLRLNPGAIEPTAPSAA